MEEKRLPVYGTDANHREKRMLDLVMDEKTSYVETKDKNGNLIRTTVDDLLISYEELKHRDAG